MKKENQKRKLDLGKVSLSRLSNLHQFQILGGTGPDSANCCPTKARTTSCALTDGTTTITMTQTCPTPPTDTRPK